MSKPKIAVLMATYNGEKYLKEQIDSILAQKQVDLSLFIYDDISKDNTVSILKEYESKNKNVHVKINEKNKNYTYNFIDAVFEFKDNQEFDYYAFADQDDFWAQDKLITGINKINEMGECSLYSSNLTVVDENLVSLNRTHREMEYKFHHHDQLFYCLVTGCTAIFDKKFKDLVTSSYPENLLYHDYWIGLIANYVKDAHYYLDMNPEHILYRQHGKNASGGSIKWGFINRLTGMFKGYEQNFYILELLLKYFGEKLKDEDKQIIEKFIKYKKWSNKKYLIKNLKCSRMSKIKFKLLFNRYIPKKIGGK